MQIEIKIDPLCGETKIIVIANSMGDDVNNIVKRLSQEASHMITGFRGGAVEILDQNDLIRIYSGGGKVYAVSDNGEYTLRLRLYKLEDMLDKSMFVRISNSEIINLKKAKSFDLSFTGTIRVAMSNGAYTYVSRRYVPKIKQILGL